MMRLMRCKVFQQNSISLRYKNWYGKQFIPHRDKPFEIVYYDSYLVLIWALIWNQIPQSTENPKQLPLYSPQKLAKSFWQISSLLETSDNLDTEHSYLPKENRLHVIALERFWQLVNFWNSPLFYLLLEKLMKKIH